jgi:hypothetical protein
MDDEEHAASLLYLATHPGATTSEVAKAVFDPDDDNDLRTADSKVRYYLTEKYDHLVETDAEGTTTFTVDDEKVDVGMGRLEIQTFEGHEFSVGLGGVVVYPDESGRLSINTVGEIEPVEDEDTGVEN